MIIKLEYGERKIGEVRVERFDKLDHEGHLWTYVIYFERPDGEKHHRFCTHDRRMGMFKLAEKVMATLDGVEVEKP